MFSHLGTVAHNLQVKSSQTNLYLTHKSLANLGSEKKTWEERRKLELVRLGSPASEEQFVAEISYLSDKDGIPSKVMYESPRRPSPSPSSILSCVIASLHSLHGESAPIRSHNVNCLS